MHPEFLPFPVSSLKPHNFTWKSLVPNIQGCPAQVTHWHNPDRHSRQAALSCSSEESSQKWTCANICHVCFLVLALLSSTCYRGSTSMLWKHLSTNITFMYMNRRIWKPVLATCKWVCPPRLKSWRSMQVNLSIIKNNRKQTGNRIKSSSQLGSSNQWHQGIAEVIHWWVLN